MQVCVLYFGAIREAIGLSDEMLEMPEGAKAADVLVVVKKRVPVLGALLERAAVALNQHYVLAEEILHEGDEVALLPPVSGGAACVV